MANLENIEPHKFQPGESGNPNGRPLGSKNRSTIFKKWLEVAAKVKNPETEQIEDGTIEDKIAVKVIKEAMEGNIKAAQEILDSVYGKSAQPITGDLSITWNEERTYEK